MLIFLAIYTTIADFKFLDDNFSKNKKKIRFFISLKMFEIESHQIKTMYCNKNINIFDYTTIIL